MRALGALALGAVIVLALLWALQRSLIYFPEQALPDAGVLYPQIEEVTFPTEDGLVLSAWLMPAASETKSGTVVVFNGNAGNRSHRVPLAQGLAERGYEVLLVDYRGYGGNPGRPSETGLATDARAALAYLRSRPGVDPERLVYFGESLGAAVAIGLAEREGPAALVLRSPFTSLTDIGSTHYPFLPVSLLLRDRYPNLETITSVDAPLMVIAGSADRIVPPQQSKRLFEAATGPKQLVEIDGADHNDFALLAGEEMLKEVAAFLDETLLSPSS